MNKHYRGTKKIALAIVLCQLAGCTVNNSNEVYGNKKYGNLNSEKNTVTHRSLFGNNKTMSDEGEIFAHDNFGNPITALDFELWDEELIQLGIDSGQYGQEVMDLFKKYKESSKDGKEDMVDEKLDEQYKDYEENVLPTIPEEEKVKPGDTVEVNPGVEVPVGGEVTAPPANLPSGWSAPGEGAQTEQAPPNIYDSTFNELSPEQQKEILDIYNSIG